MSHSLCYKIVQLPRIEVNPARHHRAYTRVFVKSAHRSVCICWYIPCTNTVVTTCEMSQSVCDNAHRVGNGNTVFVSPQQHGENALAPSTVCANIDDETPPGKCGQPGDCVCACMFRHTSRHAGRHEQACRSHLHWRPSV